MATHNLVKTPQSKNGKGLSMVHLAEGHSWGSSARVYVKTQSRYNCRPAWRGFRQTPTYLNELHALNHCSKLGIRVPRVIDFRLDHQVCEIALAEIAEAYTLREAWTQLSQDTFSRVIAELGQIVGKLHRAGWIHGALGSGHILIEPKQANRVSLIDLEKARRGWHRRQYQADFDRLERRAPFLTLEQKTALRAAYRKSLQSQA